MFQRQNHVTFIFIKTMSHDLLVQVAFCIGISIKQLPRNVCIILNGIELYNVCINRVFTLYVIVIVNEFAKLLNGEKKFS